MAEATAADKNGLQPLDVAADSGHLSVAEHLATRGAEASAKNKEDARRTRGSKLRRRRRRMREGEEVSGSQEL